MRHFACGAILVLLLPSLALAQEKTIAVPPGVKAEGMPPIPQSIADDLARYAQFREAILVAWHPAKRQLLMTTTFGAYPQLHMVDGPGRDRKQITFFPQPGVSRFVAGAFDPADPNSFVFQRSSGATEALSLYRYDMSTGAVSLVVEASIRFRSVFARQGKWLAYDSSERNGKDRDLYVVQPSDPKTKRRLADFEGAWSPEDWSPDGSTLLAIEVPGNAEAYIWRVDVKTGQKTPVTPRSAGRVAWFSARFSPDGKKVYAVGDNGGDYVRLWRCDLATSTWTPVTAATDTVLTFPPADMSGDGTLMAIPVDRGVTSEVQIVDLVTSKARPIQGMPQGGVSRILWRPGSREVGFSMGSLKTPGDVYSADASMGTVTRWTTSEVSFNPDVLPPPEVVAVTSPDGTPISGILYRPAAKFTGPRPVVVTFHGGPDQREQIRFLGRSNYFLNELGVAMLFPNVRGSSGFGRKFEQLDNGKGRDGVLKDVGALLDWIAARPDLDKTRVVFSGASYGGWLALEAGIVYNDRIRGIIAGAAPTNLVTYLEETDAARVENRRREYGDERDPQTRDYLLSISPVTRAADLKKPTILGHPGKDTRVGLGQAQELVKALKANNATVWYFEVADATHGNFPLNPVNNDFFIASWMLFFKNFVLN